MRQTLKLFEILIAIKDKSSFKRGVLRFDDFNYEIFNESLIPDKEVLKSAILEEAESLSNKSALFFDEDGSESEGTSMKDLIGDKKKKGKGKKKNKSKSKDEDEFDLKRKRELEHQAKMKEIQALENLDDEGEGEDENRFTLGEVESIYDKQKDDPFDDLIEEKIQAQLKYISLPTKYNIKSYIDGMNAIFAPKIPKSITGSNPNKDGSESFARRESQMGGVRLDKEDIDSDEDMDSKQNMRSIDIYGASIIDLSGVDNNLSNSLQPNQIRELQKRKGNGSDGLDQTNYPLNLNQLDMTQENNISLMDVTDPDIGAHPLGKSTKIKIGQSGKCK